jgi:hypothetical protein
MIIPFTMYNLQSDETLTAQLDLDFEEWRKVRDWPYEVSNYGRVRRLDWKINRRSTPFLRLHRNINNGYLFVLLSDWPRRITANVHRLVAQAFLGPRPDGYTVNHIDGNPSNAHVSNLEYVTQSQNILHAVKIGRWPVGSRRWNSKLTEDAVREILNGPTDFARVKALAAKFGVTPPTILKIINRENWKGVS